MYAYIVNKKRISFLTDEKLDLDKINLKLVLGEQELLFKNIEEIKCFIKGNHYYKYSFVLLNDIDITKVYKVKCGEKLTNVDIKQYYKTEEFKTLYHYDGDDLGVTYSQDTTSFKVWSPVASKITLKIFNDDKTSEFNAFNMEKAEKGIFEYIIEENLDGKYYTFEIECFGKISEAVDVYAKAVGTNGLRGMIINLQDTNPVGFSKHNFKNPKSITDAIIYELHVRDLSMDKNSGIKNKGKFLGLTERGTFNGYGLNTGIDHIVELGATHVHLLPSFDYKSIDESDLDKNEFNWGYDPQNYNTPEGSYSTNPEDGRVRIREMKKAIFSMHDVGLGVIMDVVYNHTYDTNISNHEKFVPGYYYRCDDLGNLTNGSACGNETASERSMVRKHFIDSLVYWALEYKIDGFRFDLMGLHDVTTMNEIRSALDKVNKDIIIYGEGWCGGETPLPEDERALKKNAPKTSKRIAYFSDDIRDAVKGDVFVDETPGFVNGGFNSIEDLKFGIVGSVNHKEVDIKNVKYSNEFWAIEPTQTVSYVSAHDNLTLYDKFIKTCPNASKDELVQMNKMAAFITHISQGALFFQAGEEFARTKNGDENSYKSPDSVNKIDWNRKSEYLNLFCYYKGLIELRKSDKVFRLNKASEVNKCVSFGECSEQFLTVNYKCKNSKYSKYTAYVNASDNKKVIKFEQKEFYDVLVNGERAGAEPIETISKELSIPPKTAVLIAKKATSFTEKSLKTIKENEKKALIIGGSFVTVVAISAISAIVKHKKKKK